MAPPEAHPEPERKTEPPQRHLLQAGDMRNGRRIDHGEELIPLKAQEDRDERRLVATHPRTQEMVPQNSTTACARQLAEPAETVRKAAKMRPERTQ